MCYRLRITRCWIAGPFDYSTQGLVVRDRVVFASLQTGLMISNYWLKWGSKLRLCDCGNDKLAIIDCIHKGRMHELNTNEGQHSAQSIGDKQNSIKQRVIYSSSIIIYKLSMALYIGSWTVTSIREPLWLFNIFFYLNNCLFLAY